MAYIGGKSLMLLKAYIDGYGQRQYEIDINYKSILPDFHDYVKERFNVKSSQGWGHIIAFFSANDVEAFDNFYKYFEEFLKGYKKPEITYSTGAIVFGYESRLIRETHYTDHGNPKHFSVPHVHEVKWLPDNSYYYDKLHGDLSFLKEFEQKDGRCNFENAEEFINSLTRGGEIEFKYNKKKLFNNLSRR